MTLLSPIPVTILTGFLGSGKTTLINYLLSHSANERIAVVENEFGAVGVDGSLLKQQSSVEVIELTNGCVCCSVRGELTQALQDLLQRRAAGDLNFERLILETTGLADPAPVIQTFFVDELLREAFLLDAVVTLVDCEHAPQQLDEHRVAVSQVGFADRLILTKRDRISDEQFAALQERLMTINARAVICEALQGALPRENWLDIHAFNLDENLHVSAPRIHALHKVGSPSSSGELVRQTDFPSQSWNDDIHSHIFQGGAMDIKRIGAFVEQCIEQHGNDMLRYKGIIAIAGEPRRLIVQGVHKVVGFDYGSEWRTDEQPTSLFVVIGRHLPIEQWQIEFQAAQAELS